MINFRDDRTQIPSKDLLFEEGTVYPTERNETPLRIVQQLLKLEIGDAVASFLILKGKEIVGEAMSR
jgi:hypothetical protein